MSNVYDVLKLKFYVKLISGQVYIVVKKEVLRLIQDALKHWVALVVLLKLRNDVL